MLPYSCVIQEVELVSRESAARQQAAEEQRRQQEGEWLGRLERLQLQLMEETRAREEEGRAQQQAQQASGVAAG